MTPSHTLSHGDTSVSIYMSPFPSVDIRMFTPAWMLSGLPCLNHVVYVQKTTEQFKQLSHLIHVSSFFYIQTSNHTEVQMGFSENRLSQIQMDCI